MTLRPHAAILIALIVVAAPAFAHEGHDHHHPARLQPVAPAAAVATDEARTWLAGDHHVHSRYSVGYTPDPANPDAPPTAIIAGDAVYPIPQNARMAHRFGLAWMVSTDHGGPNHSKLNAEQAYPELLMARREIPDLLLFYGMEFDTPGGDHSSLILPRTEAERDTLRDLESRFAKREAWPNDPARDQEPRMVEALRFMDGLNDRPVVIANHPSRSATGLGEYGQYDPAELRDWNDTAPRVAVGMEGAPGHQ
ncbi:MAG: phosphoesterase, partial [Brevundimonas sp.]